MGAFTDIWQYMPHGMCLLWQPWLVFLWAGSDAIIFVSYFLIPLALIRVIRGRTDIKHRGLVLLFAGFIMLCGLTHLMGIVTLWYPIYPFVGLLKLATGIVSAVTAVVLFRLVPILISLPSQAELERANKSLLAEIAAREKSEADLRAIRDELEKTVEARTAELSQANAKLAVVAREAVHRSRNLLTVVSSVARQSAQGKSDIQDYLSVMLGRIDAIAKATTTMISADRPYSAELRAVIENQLAPVIMTYADRLVIDGPSFRISSEAAQQIALAVHELATNAQKYGGLSGPDGQVTISWNALLDGEEPMLVFRWREDHAGNRARADAGKGSGFGTKLLATVVPAMLQGEAEIRASDDELVYELTVPISKLATDTASEGDAAMAARIVADSYGTT